MPLSVQAGIKARVLCLASIFCLVLNPVKIWSQKLPASNQPLRVAVYVEPPFVIQTPNGYGGFCVELWEMLANNAGWKWTYIQVPSLIDLVDAVTTGKADIAITDLSITAERLQRMDFTQPYFEAGLQVMVDSKRPAKTQSLWEGLQEEGHIKVLFFATLIIIVLSFLLTVIDRHWDPEFHDSWSHGWAESFYHVTSLIFTGKATHRGLPGPFGRILAGVWIVCGVAMISYITAGFTSVLTANRIQGYISGPESLSQKTVGTIEGSNAEAYCHKVKFDTQPFKNLDEAVQALLKKEIDAIVFDSPSLTYYDKSHPELPIREVGPIFAERKYGFALTLSHPYLHALNVGIISMIEDGRLAQLKAKYFGTD